ncbi:MAG: ABC transporter transmembrane domain-containing protein [Bacillus subtilis]|nr:ABC transporter transmembrane domain-containing protein [Bacillus subtilis]
MVASTIACRARRRPRALAHLHHGDVAGGSGTTSRNEMFEHAEKLSRNFYQQNKSGALMALFTNDLDAVRTSFGPGILMTFDVLFLGAFALYKMFSLQPRPHPHHDHPARPRIDHGRVREPDHRRQIQSPAEGPGEHV